MELTEVEVEEALAGARTGIWKWRADENRSMWTSLTPALLGLAASAFDGKLETFLAALHPDDRDAVGKEIKAGIAAGQQDLVLSCRVGSSSESRWLSLRGAVKECASAKGSELLLVISDATEVKLAQQTLSEEVERNELFSELASGYVYIIDLVSASLAPSIVAGSFERTTGYTPADVESLGGWTSVVHPDDVLQTMTLLDKLGKGLPVVSEYRITTKAGEIRWLRDRIHPVISAEGELVGLKGGVQDITERKTLEAQLHHAQRMEALAHLAGSVAHDFNNLLTVMFAANGMLKAKVNNSAAVEALRILETATERATDLTSSLLAFSRKQVAIRRPTLISDILARATPILNRGAGERIQVVTVDESAGGLVAVDSSQIELVLLNLVVNARDAMPEGGVVTIVTSRVEFQQESKGRPAELMPGTYFSLSVQDTGTGIANDAMPRLFEPFFTTKEAGSGTGLGLAAVYGAVRQHDGVVTVATELGVGTTFTIYLEPCHESALSEPLVAKSATIGGSEKILVVEDDLLVRSVTVRTLEGLGYQVTMASSAEAALKLVDDVDLLLTDVRLPMMPGTSLAERVSSERPDMAIVLMSGLVEDDSQKRVIESGKYHLLPKPFTPAGLARRIREALGD